MTPDPCTLRSDEPLAVYLTATLKQGEVERLRQLLAANPGLARCVVEGPNGGGRTPLHLFADWPGQWVIFDDLRPSGALPVNPNDRKYRAWSGASASGQFRKIKHQLEGRTRDLALFKPCHRQQTTRLQCRGGARR